MDDPRRVPIAAVPLVLALGLCCALAPPARSASLQAAHLGSPLSAPAPPGVGGAPPSSVEYAWRRCLPYSTLALADGADPVWRLEGSPGSFDGKSSTVALDSGPDYAGNRPYTFELWVRPGTVDRTYRFPISREQTTAAGRQGTGIWLAGAGLGFERWRDGVSSAVVYAPGLPSGVFSHVVGSYDGATMRLYVNGVQVGSRASSTALSPLSGPTRIGVGLDGHSGFFAGELTEAALYTRALPRAHVAAHRAAGSTAPCTTIAGAAASSYTPVLADLGHTLAVSVTSQNIYGSATAEAESSGPVDDGHGQFVQGAIGGLTPGATVGGTVAVTVTPAGLPADRIEWDVDGQYRYAKDAEAPYQYTWYTAAEANGPHTVTVKIWGPGAGTPVSSQVTVHVSNPTLHPTPLAFGRESMYALFNEGDLASAQNLLANVWPARGYALPYLGWPLTWTEDPYHDAFWEFYYYGMQPLPTLLYEWEVTHQAAYLDKLVAILRSYVAYDAIRPVNRTNFDNSHASAYRTMALVQFYVKLKRAGVLPADLDAGLLVSLRKLGDFLALDSHFEADYNHGFNEGAALLLLSENFPTMPGAAGWRTLAMARLRQMLSNTIDADGVEVENSPFYHVYVLGLVYQIAQWAALYEPSLAPPYTAAAQKMLTYAAEITQPNGYLPMLGATATTYMPSQDPVVYGAMAAADPGFDFAFTRGARGTPPPDGTVLFPVSGLFVMRSPLGSTANLPNQTYVTFNAGTYRTSHSALDALGMTMYSNGATLLPTSGLYTYIEEPGLEYFHGTRSHNTVVIDGANQAQGSARAAGHGAANGSTWADGSSELYAGVHHRRTIVVLRQGLTLVADELSSSSAHDYAQDWHMAPNSSVKGDGAEVKVTNTAGQATLGIHQADTGGIELRSFNGATNPMQGWYSNGYGFKAPNWALEFHRSGTAARFATLLAAGPYASQSAGVSEAPVSAGRRIEICVGATLGYTVTVPTDDATAPTILAGACAVESS